MAAAEMLQTFTVVGLRVDVDMSQLLVAAVLSGLVAEDVVILGTSEGEFTRLARDFDAPDADTAAALRPRASARRR
ncbi:hypothetical protein [Streptomyces sp. NPDC056192]|uniref:hypothetical protein n=1 Tax=unclassified Streptomyces TaxID=2593676 RepID=UPI0035D8DC6A